LNGHCKMCGMCCRLSLTVMPEQEWTEDIEELILLKGKQYVDTIDVPYAFDGSRVRRYVSVANCPHLNLITNKCMIQGHKPKECKDYPRNERDLILCGFPGCGYHV